MCKPPVCLVNLSPLFRAKNEQTRTGVQPKMKALIIREPWIGRILAGVKTWEMRTRATSIRGRIGLIRQGTGMVVGVANLVDSLPPLDTKALAASRDRHGITPERDSEAIKGRWLHPWVLRDVRALLRPVPAGQKPGQVIWVALPHTAIAAINGQV